MSDPRRVKSHLMGIATWTELESTVSAMVAAILRNDGKAADAQRAKAHDILDQHLDAKTESVTAMRADIERQFKG